MLPEGESPDLASNRKPGRVPPPGLMWLRPESLGSPLLQTYRVCTALMSAVLPLAWQMKHCSVVTSAKARVP
jgi:hypothetical protein